ncbi:MAG: hypothetical protein ACI80K_004137, partial [Paracoccaceae bacterium]
LSRPELSPNRPGAGLHRRGGIVLGKLIGKLSLVLLGFIALFETVPRFVNIPGLEPETLNPVYLASRAHQKFEPHPYLILTPKEGSYGKLTKKGITHSPNGFRGKNFRCRSPRAAFTSPASAAPARTEPAPPRTPSPGPRACSRSSRRSSKAGTSKC